MPVRRHLAHRVFWSFSLAALALLAFMIRHHVRQIDTDIHREDLSSATAAQCTATLVDVLDIEVGVRGLLLTGRKEFLQPYHEGLGRLSRDIAAVQVTLGRDPYHAPHVAELNELIRRTIAEFSNQVDATERRGLEAGQKRFLAFPTKPGVDQIRAKLIVIQAEEHRRFLENIAARERAMTTAVVMVDLFVVALGFVLVAMLCGLLVPICPEVSPIPGA